jgi:hypothetical protein
MSRLAIRFSVAAICATAFVVVPAITPAQAKKVSRHMHVVKHKWHRTHHYGRAWPSGEMRPVAGYYNQPGPICPGIGRSFECKIWPPPFEDDPDRKVSKH